MPSETVLVTDGEQRAALAIVRSLGRLGYRVVVGSSRARALAGASRYAARSVRFRNPLENPARYADEVLEAAVREAAQVVLPVTDHSLIAVLPRRADFGTAVIPFPDAPLHAELSDKGRVMEAARALGIQVPGQQVVESREAAPPGGLRFPLVIKPTRSVVPTAGGLLRLGVRYATTPEQLRTVLAGIPVEGFPVLLQERVMGPGVGVFLLIHEGNPLAQFAHRRIREKPPSGGVSVYRESIPVPAGLGDSSLALLRSFDWSGVAMVEYKLDAATGQPFLMEINGRFWGSLQLAVDAGVDFPAMLVDTALGRVPAPVTSYRSGIRSRWWLGDVDHLLARFRRSPEALSLPPGAPGRGRALMDFLGLWWPGDRAEIFRWNDPRPQARELADWVRGR